MSRADEIAREIEDRRRATLEAMWCACGDAKHTSAARCPNCDAGHWKEPRMFDAQRYAVGQALTRVILPLLAAFVVGWAAHWVWAHP